MQVDLASGGGRGNRGKIRHDPKAEQKLNVQEKKKKERQDSCIPPGAHELYMEIKCLVLC